jgi:hypothetical protein
MSVALCCNVYQDAPALRGLLEVSARFFDNIFIVHSGPGGARSTDGTIELCESFGATLVFDDIQKGFGHIRTRLIHECGCAWAFILDADERFFPIINSMKCEGTESYPKFQEPNLTVTRTDDVINQGAHIRNIMTNPHVMAIRSTRRHWFDFGMKRVSQNWLDNRDHQLRIVRNLPDIGYIKDVVMHERLTDQRTGKDPVYHPQDDMGGPFHDHFHLVFRRTQPGHKETKERNYARLSRGEQMIPHGQD